MKHLSTTNHAWFCTFVTLLKCWRENDCFVWSIGLSYVFYVLCCCHAHYLLLMPFHVKAPIPACWIMLTSPFLQCWVYLVIVKLCVSVTDPERGETGLKHPAPDKEVRKTMTAATSGINFICSCLHKLFQGPLMLCHILHSLIDFYG